MSFRFIDVENGGGSFAGGFQEKFISNSWPIRMTVSGGGALIRADGLLVAGGESLPGAGSTGYCFYRPRQRLGTRTSRHSKSPDGDFDDFFDAFVEIDGDPVSALHAPVAQPPGDRIDPSR